MSTDIKTGLQLRSLIKKSGELEISLASVPVPEPGPDEVVVRVEASPINPSDLGLLVGAADMSTAKASGTKEAPVVTAKVPEAAMKAMAGRLDESMPVGNEGAGVVIKTGSSDAAKALMGKTVAMIGGAMYAQYRCLKVSECLPLPAGITPAEGASCFVNPLTALGMTETMRREGHKALVHTAAASNLGQMLNKICLKDGIGLVNIVRSKEQADILRKIGAKHVVDSTNLHGRSDQCTGRNRSDAGVRCDRRRQACGTDFDVHGDCDQQNRKGLQPIRIERAQTGLYLWRPRHPSDRAEPGVRNGLGDRRLAVDSVPAENRTG
jgi:NADPH:quinone reductase-like Zn-dependent oxidoreductase